MIEYLVAGGPVMVPIGLCSIIGLAVFLERVWALRRGRVVPRAFVGQVLELARQGRFGDAKTLCRQYDVAASRIGEVAIDARGQERSAIKERLEEVGRREAMELERFVPALATIASISTLLGLLGTVGGMILTFQAVVEAGEGNAAALAGGIAQALITTFAGLTIAIPSVVGHRFLLARIDGLVMDLEEASLLLLDIVSATAKSAESAR